MNWLLLTLVSVFGVSFAVILQRVLMKGDRSNPYSYAIVFQLIIAILNLLIAIGLGSQIPTLSEKFPYWIVAAILWAGGSLFFFKAIQLIEASEIMIISSSRVIVTILAATVFLHEVFNIQKILGAVFIIVSIFLVSRLKKGIKFSKGVEYAFATAVFSGLAIVVDGFNVKSTDPISYNVTVNFLIFLILLFFYPKVFKQWKQLIEASFLKRMLPIGIFATVQGLAYMLALANGGSSSQVGTIRQASVVVTVILAAIFLKEKDYLGRKFIAAVLVTLGVILLR
ncbi:hypothetical protein A3G67_00360 [Candidatus Roizmanbacteria bacterium RIFCSPLOWO2_12_FULL_40_12]|uniref:EamA domain-containing protein n=1 Tax=Candidatus Roizmanbacteria bacterium RIFCSPLOWO2_01_FULL_40_42 TaxID=1802066 RepID=A0A1F7J6I0_9BACT|nr:MAG: hypothetical protein A2779_02580 [Candidatus Roizmanbacteria bacterium RIFCSPHIGHO2_01_FULL_40_98]OGK29105.1 MAG: hypothetical protein A3C31_03365 [Candidatus Roizmanbacteria bacterium RIFCSPHIGHO2_02_FULL_40_53]OGK29307.1 MAG: hypothetical protein A2W49_05015 [Candidatus Roizmanbacteria bacterium RIFCSPHIGHO2_12_41_18]OGK36006.1 MAG: hypothetical protein A3E69_03105 [Candidatus Roizmanbacteria bacterium RIFCSPHIGHO2_12_FULL_40_130]OGK51203.1 MAG: hypothetical protein A3B50_03215 [Candi